MPPGRSRHPPARRPALSRRRFAQGALCAGLALGSLTTLAACVETQPAEAPSPAAPSPAIPSPPATTPPAASAAPSANAPGFAALVQRVLPAVVSISARLPAGSDVGESGAEIAREGARNTATSDFDELLRRLIERRSLARPSPRQVALGSGFVIDASGLIVTSEHVIANAEQVTAVFTDNVRRPAKVVGADEMTDLALLQVAADSPLPAVAWSDSGATRVGDWVVAVGNSYGLGGTVSPGTVSGRGRALHPDRYEDFLQIDASINRGNSGGPVFDLAGGVIGVMAAIYTPSGGSVGISFAVPSNLARPLVEQLRAHGKVTRGWLGARVQEVTPELANALRLPKPEGALVSDVLEGAPASAAGIRAGDVVLSFNGRAIETSRELQRLVAEAPLGQKASVTIWRQDHSVRLSARVDEMPPPAAIKEPRHAEVLQETRSVLGLTLAALSPEWRQQLDIPEKVVGVLVLGITSDSPFADVDLSLGDVIVAIDQQPVSKPEEAAERLGSAARDKNRNILILINRSGAGRFIVLPADRAAQRSKSGDQPD